MRQRAKGAPVSAWAAVVLTIATIPVLADVPFASPAASTGRGGRVAALAIPSGPACTGVSNTTGNPDVAYPAGTAGIFVQRFVPAVVPFTPASVCVATFSSIATPEPYDVVVFADAGGTPGALLGLAAATPAQPGPFPGSWSQTPVPGVPPIIGPFWAGVRISTGIAANLGFETAITGVPQAVSMDGGQTWLFDESGNGSANVVVGGSSASVVPSLSGAGLAALLGGLAAAGFFLLRRP